MRLRLSVVVMILLGLAALVGPIALVLGADRGAASFGDSEAIGMNDLESAVVDLEVGASSVPLSLEAMAPGDRRSGSIELGNAGTVPLRYAIVAEGLTGRTASIDLLDVLLWEFRLAGPAGCADRSGAVLFSGVMSSQVVGRAEVGPDAGDRLLAPGDGETLCIDVELPIDIGNDFQAAVGEIEFVMIAEHAIEET